MHRIDAEECPEGCADAPPHPAPAPAVIAGLLLAARAHLTRLGLPCPRAAEILHATRAGTSQAYARRAETERFLDQRRQAPGRPPSATAQASASELALDITRQVLGFLMDHPGAVHGSPGHRRYSEAFRAFVCALRARYPELSTSELARATHVPLASLRSWLEQPRVDDGSVRAGRARPVDYHHARERQIAAIVRAWLAWDGSFKGFHEHVQHQLGLPWGSNLLAGILESHGLRTPSRQRARASHALAPRGSFHTFFPGAQWVADGTRLTVRIDDQVFSFNLELVVDTHSGALVGASVRDHEDGQAVLDAFDDAVTTTGAPPLALLLDNRPCNLSAALDPLRRRTSLIYAAKGRPQSKGHVEGAFGLFAQALPPLRLHGGDPRALARQVLELVVQCWARTLNYRPRRNRDGRSRVALYGDAAATEAQQARARASIARRLARQQRARDGQRYGPANGPANGQTALRRFLAAELTRLDIADPGGRVASALAARPAHAALAALAVYEGKRAASTLPAAADGRYLLGIARHLAEQHEGLHIAEALWRVRGNARAHLQAALAQRCRQALRAPSLDQAADALVDEAMAAAACATEQRLGLLALAWLIGRAPAARHRDLFRRAARRIHACVHLPYGRRLGAVNLLATALLPLT